MNTIEKGVMNSTQYEVQHPNAFAFAGQLKAGKGLFVAANILCDDYIPLADEAKECKKALKQTMKTFKLKGFNESAVSQNVEQGLSHL